MNNVAANVYDFMVYHSGVNIEHLIRMYRKTFGREIDDDFDSGIKELLEKLSEHGATEEQLLISIHPQDADEAVAEWKKITAESAVATQQYNQWVEWVNAVEEEDFSNRD